MDIHLYEIVITRHAMIRALEREITPDMIHATIKGGNLSRFGRRNIRFVKDYGEFRMICVDDIIGETIRIVTVEKG
jgi:hypothetical protein